MNLRLAEASHVPIIQRSSGSSNSSSSSSDEIVSRMIAKFQWCVCVCARAVACAAASVDGKLIRPLNLCATSSSKVASAAQDFKEERRPKHTHLKSTQQQVTRVYPGQALQGPEGTQEMGNTHTHARTHANTHTHQTNTHTHTHTHLGEGGQQRARQAGHEGDEGAQLGRQRKAQLNQQWAQGACSVENTAVCVCVCVRACVRACVGPTGDKEVCRLGGAQGEKGSGCRVLGRQRKAQHSQQRAQGEYHVRSTALCVYVCVCVCARTRAAHAQRSAAQHPKIRAGRVRHGTTSSGRRGSTV
eukprot:1158893-Pelagomonas_calceolata.AAC.13